MGLPTKTQSQVNPPSQYLVFSFVTTEPEPVSLLLIRVSQAEEEEEEEEEAQSINQKNHVDLTALL